MYIKLRKVFVHTSLNHPVLDNGYSESIIDSNISKKIAHFFMPKRFGPRCCRFKGIHSMSDTNRTGDESLSFYYPRLLYCLNQMLAVVLLSQHRVLSSKTVRPRAPCGARCIGQAVSTWSSVCSEAPHLQFDKRSETSFVHGRMESPNTSP